jgi:1,4-alpha-glucan branching enzyme
VVSPEILPDKKVTFRLRAPKASEVLLNGNWDGGRNIQMTKDDACIWSVTKTSVQRDQKWRRAVQKSRSKEFNTGRGRLRLSTASC